MNHLTGVIQLHARNKFTWFLVPWIGLLSSLAANLFIGLLFGGKATIYTGGLIFIFIFMCVLGSVSLNDTFAFALGFGVRRADYILGTVLLVLAVSVATACVIFLSSLIESTFIVGWDPHVYFFYLPYLNDGSLIWVYFVLLVHMYFLGFVIGSIYQRFGKTGMWFFAGGASLIVSISSFVGAHFRWWDTLFTLLSHHSAFELALWLASLSVVYVLVSYRLLRKATV